jgi:Protein of unknown function (DUF3253)
VTKPLSAASAESAILHLLTAKGAARSICPTEAARQLAGNPADDSWRLALAPIRQAALHLARAGQIEILRKGKPVGPDDARGVIRLRLAGAPPFPESPLPETKR